MKKILILTLLMLPAHLSLPAQTTQEDMKREVTLYNPFKPSLPDARKRSFLPDLTDTIKVTPDFRYQITPVSYSPEYTISPIKAASLIPDPLPELYKGYVNIGIGNYFTPLAEISVTNERSKQGTIGIYGRHFSTNGRIKLQNDERVYAGYMDNDVSLFGKKFFRRNLIEGSADFTQKTRYAYGYDTSIVGYTPKNDDIRIGYNNLGADVTFSSLNLDSMDFSYDFNVHYDLFFNGGDRYQHNTGLNGEMSKIYKGFYVGAGLQIEYFNPSDIIYNKNKYIVSANPYVTKISPQWNFRLGLQLLVDKNINSSALLHLYPDISFGFNIVPSFLSFYADLKGKLETNDPLRIIEINPFMAMDGSLFRLPNTSYPLVVSAGFKGNNGMGGNYRVNASYSMINDMIFFSNLVFPDSVQAPQMGNFFIPLRDDIELFNIHGELTGMIGDKISFRGLANWYQYTLTKNNYAWNKPDWDGLIGVKYNLRNKIIAGVDLTATGKLRVIATEHYISSPPTSTRYIIPAHFNLNLSAEYRYTKILSVWARINNISINRYYEWAYYPSQRFLGMIGFTYSM